MISQVETETKKHSYDDAYSTSHEICTWFASSCFDMVGYGAESIHFSDRKPVPVITIDSDDFISILLYNS